MLKNATSCGIKTFMSIQNMNVKKNSDLPKSAQIGLANFVLNKFKKVSLLNLQVADTNFLLYNGLYNLLITVI